MSKHDLHGAAGAEALARALEQAVQISLAMQAAAERRQETPIPALSGCPACRTTRMIAGPLLGLCPECGAELSVLGSTTSPSMEA